MAPKFFTFCNSELTTTINTQECSRLAFNKRGRSLQASDLTEEVHTAFLNIFGEEEDPEVGGQKL